MTKRVYEVAKELGVSASDIIKTLGEHNIKATNFSGVDDQAKHVLGKITARTSVKMNRDQKRTTRTGITARRIIRDNGRKQKREMSEKKDNPAIISIVSSRI